MTSPALVDGQPVPTDYTCDGDEISPPLRWSELDRAGEYAVTVTDPDAPGGTFVHWVVWGLEPSAGELAEGSLPAGSTQGSNGNGDSSYAGPCPPEGDPPHRYVFTVYAFEHGATSGLTEGASLEELLTAIRCCTLGRGSLTATYGRP